jgi:peptide/nickel transport system permease protein
MLRYVFIRLGGGLLTVWAVLTLVFLAVHLAPGDPAQAALAQSAAPADVLQQRREALDLDLPISEQYYRYMGRLARGDLGVSWATGQGWPMVAQWAPRSSLPLQVMVRCFLALRWVTRLRSGSPGELSSCGVTVCS